MILAILVQAASKEHHKATLFDGGEQYFVAEFDTLPARVVPVLS